MCTNECFTIGLKEERVGDLCHYNTHSSLAMPNSKPPEISP